MSTNTKLVFNSLPVSLKEILKKIGINDLFPPQAEAIKKGVLDNKNFVLSMPTASGKTLIAELCILQKFLSRSGNCLYIVPLRALASEKFEDFKEKYSYLGIKVSLATGDFDYIDYNLTKNDILIATAEKVDSILRQKPTWLCERLSCIVVDEIHYIGDAKRGPTLETIITRLININPRLKILGLSATISNAQDIANWLAAELVLSDFRPVPLKEGVYCQGQIRFANGQVKQLNFDRTKDEIAALALDCLADKGQVLIFVNTRRSAQAEARRIAKEISSLSHSSAYERLQIISKQVDKTGSETTKVSKQLSECLKSGVAFHHAGLHYEHRKIIEDNFRNRFIKIICATPTLAAGVNLPSRRTIIRALYRYASGVGMKPVSVLEYKQMSGRAGRPKYDKFGESILVAKNHNDQDDLFRNFIYAHSEPIQSYLGSENALRVHLLASIVSGFVSSLHTAGEFLSKTFFAYTQKYYDLTPLLARIIDFLEQEAMIIRKKDKFLPTAFGTRISRLYIDPISAVIIRDCLPKIDIKNEPLAILYLICSVPDMSILALNRSDIEKIFPFIDQHKNQFELAFPLAEDYSGHLAKIKTVWMFKRWADEEKEEIICEQFGVGPGDIHRFVETADWLLYAAIELAKLFKVQNLKYLYDLKTQIHYGIKAELIPLVSLKNIGRVRARSMYTRGYRTIAKIKTARLEKLQKIPNIGKELAISLKKQLQCL